ncbi:hypothetical protein AWENTII_005593 [Aspergillus wentii]
MDDKNLNYRPQPYYHSDQQLRTRKARGKNHLILFPSVTGQKSGIQTDTTSPSVKTRTPESPQPAKPQSQTIRLCSTASGNRHIRPIREAAAYHTDITAAAPG